jgi:hypothetical protein
MSSQTKDRVLSKIEFLENQLIALDHYLPETYEYLMAELDVQKRQLAEIEVLETYQQIDADRSDAPSGNARRPKYPRDSFSRTENRNKKGQGT